MHNKTSTVFSAALSILAVSLLVFAGVSYGQSSQNGSVSGAGAYGVMNDAGVNCPIISSPGTYVMPTDYSGAPNSAPGGTTACIVINSSNVVFDCAGNTVTNNGASGTTYGIMLSGATNVTVQNCPGVSGYSEGIYVYQSDDSTLINNLAYDNAHAGFYLSSGSSNDIVTDNTAFGNVQGFLTQYGSNNTITDNVAYDNTFSFDIEYDVNTTLANNLAHDSPGDGFFVDSSSNVAFTNNSAYNNGNCDFLSLAGADDSFTGNTAHGSFSGFYLTESGSIITDNLAYNGGNVGFALESGSSDDTLAGNSAYNNSQIGFFLSGSNDIIADNSAHGNGDTGFDLFYESGSSFTNNFAYDNSGLGIYVYSSSGNTFTNDTASDNSNGGLFIDNSSRMSLHGQYFSNNYPDLVVKDDSSSPFTINLSGLVFDNPLGNMQNYTNLSVNDRVSSGESYSISWTRSPSSIPAGESSFAQKFVNITALSGAPSIDSVTWTWLGSELTGYNQSGFQLWGYNSTSWTLLHGTLNTTARTLSLARLKPGGVYGIFQKDINPSIDNVGALATRNLITAPPSIRLKRPANGTIIESSTPISVDLAFTATDASSAKMNCSLYFDKSLKYTNSSFVSGSSVRIAVLASVASHSWSVTCQDVYNSTDSSPTYVFTVSAPVRRP
jgi:parallel beta-helix repeat protein